MTGIFVRIERNGKWQALELDELTQEELTEFVSTMELDKARAWVIGLVKWIHEFDKKVKEILRGG